MKDALVIVGALLTIVALVAGAMYATRLFSNATTPLVLHNPKPGITCAAMVTGDGAALSCWKD